MPNSPASRLIPVLIVQDMSAALRFYAETLGGAQVYQFPPEGEPGFVTLRIGASEMALSVIGASMPLDVPKRPATGHRIQLSVNVASVDDAVGALAKLGARTAMEPSDQPWGERAAYMEDPDGNLVLLVSPLGNPA